VAKAINRSKVAKKSGKGKLGKALEFYFEDRGAVPPPSVAECGQHAVELPPSLSAKILLLNGRVAQNVRPAELARRFFLYGSINYHKGERQYA
jgi:antitoxin HicB